MSQTNTAKHIATQDIADYQAARRTVPWLQELRRGAFEQFKSTEWPTTSEEEWRRTSLRAFEFDGYAAAGPPDKDVNTHDGTSLRPETLIGVSQDELAGYARYLNGSPVSLSLRDDLAAEGVILADAGSLPEGEGRKPLTDAIQDAMARADNRIQHWHYSLITGIPCLYIPRGVVIDAPFVIEIEGTGDETVVPGFLVVVTGESSAVSIVKRTTTSDEGEILFLEGEYLGVGAGSSVRYTTIQSANNESICFSNGTAVVGRDSSLHRTEAALGGDFVKTRFVTDLVGPGADVDLNGIYCGAEEQHMDLRTVQNHIGPHSTSRAFYRGAVRDEAHSIYQGLIQVAPEAAGTDSYLTNKNLVLSDSARSDSIPSLNIRTDDVRCSHGSTTGKLDQDKIFYLQARGYPVDEARRTLIEGHFEDLITQTPEMVRDVIRDLISDRLFEDV